MKTTILNPLIGIAAIAACLSVTNLYAQQPSLLPVYAKAEPAAVAVDKATSKARQRNKNILLVFGADWCPWCHKLHNLFQADTAVAQTLARDYEVVLVNTDDPKNARFLSDYPNPKKIGQPFLAVLNSDGKKLTVQETGALEEGDHHSSEKVNAFLMKFAQQPPSAQDMLSKAAAKAKSENKMVLPYFVAPWCPWCHKFDDFLLVKQVAQAIEAGYVPVRIDIERSPDGKQLMAQLRQSNEQSIPYFAVLTPNKTRLSDSVGESGNVGFPVEPQEVAHFIQTLQKHSAKIDTETAQLLREQLKKAAQTGATHNES